MDEVENNSVETIITVNKQNALPADLISKIKDIEFFKQRALTEETLAEVVSCMSLLEMEKDDVVMEYGDIGYNFYLTLEGEVEITVPDPNHKKAFL